VNGRWSFALEELGCVESIVSCKVSNVSSSITATESAVCPWMLWGANDIWGTAHCRYRAGADAQS
jgi:hypothetical protein